MNRYYSYDPETQFYICYYTQTIRPLTEPELRKYFEILQIVPRCSQIIQEAVDRNPANTSASSSRGLSNESLVGRRPTGLSEGQTDLSVEQTRRGFTPATYYEIGPRLGFQTPWSSHLQAILNRANLGHVIQRVEKSRISNYLTEFDFMTEMIYLRPLTQFENSSVQSPIQWIPLSKIANYSKKHQLGFDQQDLNWYSKIFAHRSCLSEAELYDLAQSNSEHSRHWLFNARIFFENGKPAPASLFQLVKAPLYTLQSRRKRQDQFDNSLIAFRDNSSAIYGYTIEHFRPNADQQYQNLQVTLHPTLTVETHNFPTGIAPFPGAATGSGGRIRDQLAIGRGGLLSAGTVGYCVGRLNLNSDQLTVRSAERYKYPRDLSPIQILIAASNGASDYGNKIGEPLIQGFARSFGHYLKLNNDQLARLEYVKPIMLSGGLGQVQHQDLYKAKPAYGNLIVRLGGPTYRIGIGGGSASSRSQSAEITHSDLSAVQRPDPEMENRLARVIRTLIESDHNPILSIHDQGSGGMANVTKEIISPMGGLVSLGNVNRGDQTLTALETWISESQEQVTILIHVRDIAQVKAVCARENCPIEFVGLVTNSGHIQVYDGSVQIPQQLRHITALTEREVRGERTLNSPLMPVNMNLVETLEEVPFKTVYASQSESNQVQLNRLILPAVDQLHVLVKRVWSQLAVGSKRFLVNKVDRSVGGLVVQQQTVGPLETPISNYAITAQTYESTTGIVTSQGEQPIKMLLDPIAAAQLTVGEMLTNLIWVPIDDGLNGIKCSGNWMWEKQSNEEVDALYRAVNCLSKTLIDLGLAIDGGKDSLSMSAVVNDQRVYSPRSLVLSAYATCSNFNCRVTPDIKGPVEPKPKQSISDKFTDSTSPVTPIPITPIPSRRNKFTTILNKFTKRQTTSPNTQNTFISIQNSDDIQNAKTIEPTVIIFVDLAWGKQRLGGSALAQHLAEKQKSLGHEVPGFENIDLFPEIWNYIQKLIITGKILAGHDRSDGGLITTLAEMAMAGNVGLDIDLSDIRCSPNPESIFGKYTNYTDVARDPITFLFNEELGLCLEFTQSNWDIIGPQFSELVHCYQIATINQITSSAATLASSNTSPRFRIFHRDQTLLDLSLGQVRSYWEITSHRLDRRQANSATADNEYDWLSHPDIKIPKLEIPATFWSLSKVQPTNIREVQPTLGHQVAIIREQGSNGDREMAQAFYQAGFQVHDVTTAELIKDPELLKQFQGLAWVGGFSFADVLGAGRGWALSLTNHPPLKQALDEFRNHPGRFSLGICNGAQLMAQLGWVPGQFLPNYSKKFESRFIQVQVPANTNAVLLKDLNHLTLGVWIAHGEGRYQPPDTGQIEQSQISLHYYNSQLECPANEDQYPHNPNGSYQGIAGVCSADGRHLAMMPHPERTIYNWQVPWTPPLVRQELDQRGYVNQYPWLELFRNAYRFINFLQKV